MLLTVNLGNTNIGFANALLGGVTSYSESDGHPSAHGQFMNTEFYAQDNWRVNRKFTIDAGVRFYYITPTQSEGDRLRHSVRTCGPLKRHAMQPVSTRRAAAHRIGRWTHPRPSHRPPVPGPGGRINGMQVFDGTPQQKSPFKVAPRVGFAWDVAGDGKTAVRGGWGVFYDRYQDDWILDLIELPPVLNTYNLFYTTLPELLNNPLTATPTGVRYINEFTPPTVYNWSLGVQREIGFQLVADVAYVGNKGTNSRSRAINGRPMAMRICRPA
jgi:hypothetical protein